MQYEQARQAETSARDVPVTEVLFKRLSSIRDLVESLNGGASETRARLFGQAPPMPATRPDAGPKPVPNSALERINNELDLLTDRLEDLRRQLADLARL